MFPVASPCHHPRHHGSANQKRQSCSYGSPHGGAATPPQYFRNGRAEICPNPYARGDYVRPCYARQRSLKREPAYRKTKHIPERVSPTRRGISRCLLSATSFNCYFTHTQKDIASRFFKIFHLILFYPYAKGYHALPCAYPCREHGFFMRKGYRFKNSPLSPAGILVPYGGVITPPQYFNKVGLRWARTHTPAEIT